jgi:hypothetical protein
MIVIFASSWDASAAALAERWAAHHASLLTSGDLSRVGWRHHLGSPEHSTAVVTGRVVPVQDITGVLIRWPGVFSPELMHIVAADRDYVAEEMRAFLVSWLSSLRCPVINRPTPLNLAGPAWRLEQWNYMAARLGISVRPVHRRVTPRSESERPAALPAGVTAVTVVGDCCFGTADAALCQQARQLADAAGVQVLQVSFSGPSAGSTFVGANLVPDLSEQVADAVLDLLLDGSSRG